ncbi:MAG TPA: hypothetical protein VLG27_03550 [Candidatus Saccharimonadia bacterium]|nr:hypothetical protein [Candidatus Saccharimonadia bacterium]
MSDERSSQSNTNPTLLTFDRAAESTFVVALTATGFIGSFATLAAIDGPSNKVGDKISALQVSLDIDARTLKLESGRSAALSRQKFVKDRVELQQLQQPPQHSEDINAIAVIFAGEMGAGALLGLGAYALFRRMKLYKRSEQLYNKVYERVLTRHIDWQNVPSSNDEQTKTG